MVKLIFTETSQEEPNIPNACPRRSVPNWRPPSNNRVKLNSNDQFELSNGRGWAGIIAPSPLVAEAQALREAIIYASNSGLHFANFESDYLRLIDSCNGKSNAGEIQVILQDIKELSDKFTFCEFMWTKRSGNVVADALAKMAVNGSLPRNWLSSLPVALARLVAADGAAM